MFLDIISTEKKDENLLLLLNMMKKHIEIASRPRFGKRNDNNYY